MPVKSRARSERFARERLTMRGGRESHDKCCNLESAGMKLATLADGSRDGQLAVVSREGRQAVLATRIAGTLQRALDDWPFYAPQLAELYDTLNAGAARHAFAFDTKRCMAPLPRAHQW